jgi:hypothetical protein
MPYCPRVSGDVKARVGVDNVFEFVAPGPLLIDLTHKVTLTIHLAGGPVVLDMLAAQPELVDGTTPLSDDRQTIFMAGLSWASRYGWAGRNGEGWLVGPNGAVSLRLADGIDGTVAADGARLFSPLPWSVALDSTSVVQLSYCQAVLPALTVCATKTRDVLWTVDYWIRHGTNTDLAAQRQQESGLLQVVAQPFGTGVSAADVPRYLRSIGAAPSTELGYEMQLQAAEEELVLWLRSHLAERGLTEDDVPAPQSLRLPHLMLTGAHILAVPDGDTSDRLRARAVELAEMAMRRIWLDQNQDGAVDPDEVQQTGGRRSADWRSPVRTATNRFTVGMSH